ncbi:alpha/beta hydrolase [Romboutsia sedimentorum]|uniref:alpha/beta hydrolase n=1 Tax=Romboutsia sedimentorum TaxID=1368474 RepID=UPI0024DE224B|nr:alpha/beta hydrolase [Romboutsia sedimentorum]MDK2584784.1 alpha/beta hydrolase [Romboutsia sedimentorum]
MGEDIDVKENAEQDTFSITMELQRPLFVDKVEEINDKNEKKSNIKRKLLLGIGISSVIAVLGTFIWLTQTYSPKETAKAALVSNKNVDVKINDYISFTPKNVEATKGFILYPGAKVEPEVYAPFCEKIAEKGYEVVIIESPLNIPLLGKNEAEKVMNDYRDITHWVVGGHSLGGVAASDFASKNNMVDGVVLLASYPMNDDLKKMGKEVLSIWGSKDGVVNFKDLIKSREKLPESTTYVEVEGANHSQFGDYGLQRGDNEAIITSERQMNITYKNIVKFLENIN